MNELPDTIDVVIPAQEFDEDVYIGLYGRCYLETELDKLFPDKNVRVHHYGHTEINGQKYRPTAAFGYCTVQESFDAGQDIHLTLKKRI